MKIRICQIGLVLLVCQNVSAHGSIHEQIRQVTLLISERPQDASLHVRRGELHRVHEDWSRALADYAAAVELDPTIIDRVELLRGILFYQSGQDGEARTALDNFLRHSPHHTEGLITRARVLVRLGKTALAIEDYDDALSRIERPEPGYYVERAKAILSLGQEHTREAVLGLEQGIAAVGPVVTLLLTAIDLEVADGRFDSALARFDQIISQASRKSGWLYRRGEILERAGRNKNAAEVYREALRLIESLPSSRRWTSRTLALESKLRAKLDTEGITP